MFVMNSSVFIRPWWAVTVAIVATLGSEMTKFVRWDQLVHSLSVSIGEAAAKGDFARIESDYQQMLNACIVCHGAHKTRVSTALGTATEKAD